MTPLGVVVVEEKIGVAVPSTVTHQASKRYRCVAYYIGAGMACAAVTDFVLAQWPWPAPTPGVLIAFPGQ